MATHFTIDPANYTAFKLSRKGRVLTVCLSTDHPMNGVDARLHEEFATLFYDLQRDSESDILVLTGEGRAFCAGGDVIMLHDSGKKDGKDAEEFWRVEYALNELIHVYGKPYISLIDGIVMGGGVGLSVHGRHRVAGDNTLFAMPETGIGYFPDVGGTYFLPRLGKSVGNWLGLTGARAITVDVCTLGIANHYVPSEQHADLIDALGKAKLDGSDAAAVKVLNKFAKTPPAAGNLPGEIGAFGRESVTEILNTLDELGTPWAVKQAGIMRKKSPLAMSVTLETLNRGASLNFREAMTMELDLSLNFLKTQDFYEGIRSQLIDKDRNPKWSHDDTSKVTDKQIERLFKETAKPRLEFLS